MYQFAAEEVLTLRGEPPTIRFPREIFKPFVVIVVESPLGLPLRTTG
jgi:hypothetical protein